MPPLSVILKIFSIGSFARDCWIDHYNLAFLKQTMVVQIPSQSPDLNRYTWLPGRISRLSLPLG
ncbi:hypothetical protein Vca1114GL_02005 [Vibrio campbellii]|nr:hypothetical protein Vca1114GL_02005 [Vibrio campbellii]